MVLDECTPYPVAARRGAAGRWSARCAGRSGRATDFSAARGDGTGSDDRPERPRARRSSASCRAASSRTCATRAPPAPSPSASRATPSAASASASRSISCTRSSAHGAAAAGGQPRYLMGAGTPTDLVECVARGIDMFDCVLPTRNARNGQLFTSEDRLNIKNARYAEDERPPDPDCGCSTCRRSRAPICATCHGRGDAGRRPSTRCTISYFYLDTMRRLERLLSSGPLTRSEREFLETFSRQTLRFVLRFMIPTVFKAPAFVVAMAPPPGGDSPAWCRSSPSR